LVLAGAIFFVAYNWMAMDKMVKLGGVQLLILGAAGSAWYRGLARVDGRVLLFAACVLVGVFLAAFGQIYQTGADAWELFRGWALLIMLWVVASRAPAHWLLLLAVTDAAVALYLDQVLFYRWEEETWAWLLLAAIQILALAGLELGNACGYFALRQAWPRWILVPAVFFLFCSPATKVLVQDEYDRIESWLVALGFACSVIGGFAYFRHRAPDLFALTCIGFSVAWLLTVLSFRLLTGFDFESCGSMVFVGLIVVGLLAALVRWIRRLNAAMRAEAQQQEPRHE
jgi:uncharacterized membrane protein